MSIIVHGEHYEFPLAVETYNWITHPRQCPKTKHFNARNTWARAVTIHCVHGTAEELVEDLVLDPEDPDPSDADLRYARYQASTTRNASWHFTIDIDGSIAQSADPATEVTWHACQVNPFTIGIELVQTAKKAYTKIQMDSMVCLVDLLSASKSPKIAIQRQVPWADGVPFRGNVMRLLYEQGSGRSVVGVYEHRNVWFRSKKNVLKPYRSRRDAGDRPIYAFAQAGYELFDLNAQADQEAWRQRQQSLELEPDGLPGPATREKIREKKGLPAGIWVERPIDKEVWR